MDNIILGLLLLESRTIYQLRERIRKGMDLMYSSSMGSIQAAIKKLLNHGYIGYEESVENGKYKKTYTITDSGKRCFFEWVNSPFEVQNTKNPELVKVYFMGFSDKTSRRNNIEKYLSHLTEKYHVLNAICEEARNVNITEENKDIIFYQLSAARYGRDFMKFNIEWYKKLINEMEDKK
ncbi:MAG: PadR family transcriptional regulator [Lachnospiraceae bacterium]|nr:PadR family transcriptional regulator [Lachnospiraceae bacterium]MCI8827125.1 PadR family transcriptional regulator [Lachnospiraceae bacterium]